MLYLAIDLHSRQLTVNLRDEAGTILLRRQVSTEWAKVRAFLAEVRELAARHGGFWAIVEVCGFEDWLLKLLVESGCARTVLVQSKGRAKHKTDRSDANKLGEQLWMNRFRLAAGERLQQLRHIKSPSDEDAASRQITMVRMRMGQERTRMMNQIQRLLRKHNLRQECPAKGVRTTAATPSCRNTGETKQRLGSITKEGSTIVRFLLGQAVYHMLRKCPKWRTWYRGVKARRGSKIARVGVMRRLATSIWHMVKQDVPFDPDVGFRGNSTKTQCPTKTTRSSAGEGTSRARPEIKRSSLSPHPQLPSPSSLLFRRRRVKGN